MFIVLTSSNAEKIINITFKSKDTADKHLGSYLNKKLEGYLYGMEHIVHISKELVKIKVRKQILKMAHPECQSILKHADFVGSTSAQLLLHVLAGVHSMLNRIYSIK